MKKSVNGVEIELSPAEVQQRLLEDALWLEKKSERERRLKLQHIRQDSLMPDPYEKIDAIISALDGDRAHLEQVKVRIAAVKSKYDRVNQEGQL